METTLTPIDIKHILHRLHEEPTDKDADVLKKLKFTLLLNYTKEFLNLVDKHKLDDKVTDLEIAKKEGYTDIDYMNMFAPQLNAWSDMVHKYGKKFETVYDWMHGIETNWEDFTTDDDFLSKLNGYDVELVYR